MQRRKDILNDEQEERVQKLESTDDRGMIDIFKMKEKNKLLTDIDDIYDMELDEFNEYLNLRAEDDIRLWKNKQDDEKTPGEAEFWSKLSELKKIQDKLKNRL